eukprot:1815825-Rhodomonas_salina.3
MCAGPEFESSCNLTGGWAYIFCEFDFQFPDFLFFSSLSLDLKPHVSETLPMAGHSCCGNERGDSLQYTRERVRKRDEVPDPKAESSHVFVLLTTVFFFGPDLYFGIAGGECQPLSLQYKYVVES